MDTQKWKIEKDPTKKNSKKTQNTYTNRLCNEVLLSGSQHRRFLIPILHLCRQNFTMQRPLLVIVVVGFVIVTAAATIVKVVNYFFPSLLCVLNTHDYEDDEDDDDKTKTVCLYFIFIFLSFFSASCLVCEKQES